MEKWLDTLLRIGFKTVLFFVRNILSPHADGGRIVNISKPLEKSAFSG